VKSVYKVQYNLVRSKRRKHLAITVSDLAEVVVLAPLSLSQRAIDRFVAEKQQWISAHVSRLEQLPQPLPEHTYTTGDTFLFGGELLQLRVVESTQKKTTCMREGCFLIVYRAPRAKSAAIQKAIMTWYRTEGLTVYQYFVSFWSQTLGLKFVPGTNLSGFPKRWGSCSRTGDIRFAFRSLMLPIHMMNYLALHEVVHVLHFNHGSEFKRILQIHIPQWKSIQKEMNHLRLRVSQF